MHIFGERLKELRKSKGLLGKDLASLFEVEPATITNWEKGKRFPKDDILIKIADFFENNIFQYVLYLYFKTKSFFFLYFNI